LKPLHDILTILKSSAETDLPSLLISAALENFAVYHVGPSRNAKEIGLFIYQDNSNMAYDRETISVMVQLQLYNISGLDAAKYTDIVSEYFRDYEPANIECDMLQMLDVDSWPLDENSTSYVYITCTWTSELDSCDNP
jgi:hypothetical protein